MNKARKKTYKKGIFKRLVNESFVLSSTRFVSSRVVRFFETGWASPILAYFDKVDGFISQKLTGPLFEKVQLRKKVGMPARNAVASAVANNSVIKMLSYLRNAFLNSSLRSVGLFMTVFGVYTAAIFLLKRYIASSLGVAAINDICTAAVMLVVGLLLMAFGDKSIVSSVGNGLIGSFLFSDCLGVNDSSFERSVAKPPKFAMITAFLSGTVLGMLTLLMSPLRILYYGGALIVIAVIFNIPEFGLLLAIATCSFVHMKYVAAVTALTVASYFIKCLRLKRNFRFGTADAFMLFVFVSVIVGISKNGFTDGGRYIICSLLLYFVAKNIICSEKLLKQSFNALTLGLFVGIILDLLGEYAHRIPFAGISSYSSRISAYAMDGEILAMLAVTVLPFVFFSFSSFNEKRAKLPLLLLVLASVLIYDSWLYYVLMLVSLFVFNGISKKSPIEAILGGAVVMTPVLFLVKDFVKSAVVTSNSAASMDASLGMASSNVGFWSAFYNFGGIIGIVLLVLSLLLIFQRILGCMAKSKSAKINHLCGTVVSSAVMILVCGFMFNPFADLRMISVMWFMLGLCGSATTVALNSQHKDEEV